MIVDVQSGRETIAMLSEAHDFVANFTYRPNSCHRVDRGYYRVRLALALMELYGKERFLTYQLV